MKEFEILWQEVLDILHETYDSEIYDELFEPLSKVERVADNYIYVVAPSLYVQSRINRLYLTKINSLAQSIYKKNLVGFKFVLEEELVRESSISSPEMDLSSRYREGDLNAVLSFNNFVVGKSNRFAFQMALKVADQPGAVANPFYIFGDVGLGKTHLMQAIGNYILDSDIEQRILYQKASDFLEHYVTKVSTNKMDEFNEMYRNVDVLLIDDIQQLSDKKNTQMEFFKVFDYLTNKNKQIVLTSDKPANELRNMMSRLTSRFQQGLVVDISVPDLEHRVEILRKKLALETPESMSEVDVEVLEFIASYFITNIRELEGALKRVLYYCMINNIPINVKNAEEALEPLIQTKKRTDMASQNNYDKILSVTAEYYSVTVHDVVGSSRKNIYTLPRHIAMYLIKTKYDIPYKTIGSFFNNRDHSTVLNAVEKIQAQRNHDRELNMAIEHIIRKLDKWVLSVVFLGKICYNNCCSRVIKNSYPQTHIPLL